jgi:hypothetical protein
MSKFINGFNCESNIFVSTSAESAEDKVFWEDAETIVDILSTNAFFRPDLVCIKDGKGVYDFRNAFLAAEHTLQLIKYGYSRGNLLDSYLLLRRLFESILQYLFFVSLKQDQENEVSSGSEEKSLKDAVEAAEKMIKALEFDDSGTSEMSIFHQWAVGNSLNKEAEKKRKKVIRLRYYLERLAISNPDIKVCNEKYLEPQLSDVQQIMNDFTHGNTLHAMAYAFDVTKEAKNYFKERLSYILSVLLSYITLVRPQLLKSSDYIDVVESGRRNESGCQCWIAPGIQHYFDVYVNKIHPDLVKYLKENNPIGMIINVPESKG